MCSESYQPLAMPVPLLVSCVPPAGQQVPVVSQTVNKLIAEFELSFFKMDRWRAACKPFVVPGEGYWMDIHRIEKLRTSTFKDFTSATPMPMPVYIDGNPFIHVKTNSVFKQQVRPYHLCKKVAVAFDGKVYRATDAEIEAALQNEETAPSCSAATYVKAVQEVRRRHEIERARLTGTG